VVFEINFMPEQFIKIDREIKGVIVPFGDEITLPRDTEVVITQALGGTYTVIANGQMVRIGGEYADVLGVKKPEAEAQEIEPKSLTERVWLELRTCYDPEIPINIVDLGLIYAVETTPSENGHDVKVTMTLTAPGCGMGPVIAAEAEHKILALGVVNKVIIELVFDPPWDRSRMSEQAKLELGMW